MTTVVSARGVRLTYARSRSPPRSALEHRPRGTPRPVTDSNRPLRVAVVGAGPAGIYASDILSKADLSGTGFDGVGIDLIERLPAPFGLVRYGVAPDHPRIKQIIVALEKVLSRGDIRLLTNVDFGTDVTLEDLQRYYDAVVFSTGSIEDARLEIPGVDAPESYGAADFVSWYDGHPDYPRTWPLDAERVAVLGAGNVALDVARILAKHADDLLPTEIPDNVYEVLKASPVTDVHVFARRGPAQVKFSPLELRELGHVPDVDVLVDPEDFDFDEGSEQAIASSNQTRQVVKTLTDWTLKEGESTASRRIHLHFLHAPAEVLTDAGGHVSGLRTERTRLVGDGTVEGTGDFHDWDVQAVYRAVGYFGSPLPGVPFDALAGVIANHEGRVTDPEGGSLPASTAPAGSSAVRSASSATRSRTPPRRSGTWSPTPRSCRRRASRTPRPCWTSCAARVWRS